MKGATEPASKGKRWGISKLKVFLIALSYAYMIKGMSGAYSKNIITQLERRFRISASLAGLIDASFEIGNLLVIAFVSYFGAKLHRPRMLAVGCLVMGLGCCLSSLPHLLMERYHYEKAFTPSENSSSMALCMANESQWNVPEAEECGNEVESLMWVYVLMGNILRGVGETPIAPLGLSYLDDFAKQENSPLYIGIVHTVEVAGPLIGSLLAAFCAQLYVDFPSTDLADVTLEKNDARWVGAWWLGYLINASVTLLAAVPFCFLPKSLPKEGEEDKPKSLETTKGHKERHVPRSQQSIAKDFLPCLKGLFCNPVYVLFLVITVMQFNAYTGMLTFVPKYVEVMYGKSASEAIFLLAVYNIPVIGVGYFLGGLLMKKFKISTFYAANISFWTSVLDYSLFFFLAFVFVCKNSTLAGITVAYDSTPQISNTDLLQSECNVDCSCPTTIWDPVCGDNGLTYASACLAGCDSSTWTRKQFVLSNCSCIEASGLPFINASAVSGSCPREGACDTMLQSFLIMSLVTCLIYAVGGMPGYMVLIREPEKLILKTVHGETKKMKTSSIHYVAKLTEQQGWTPSQYGLGNFQPFLRCLSYNVKGLDNDIFRSIWHYKCTNHHLLWTLIYHFQLAIIGAIPWALIVTDLFALVAQFSSNAC
ncbi:solute carrier organic anion transporter family member 1A2-like isoform X2 [Pleurodeles waltl]|uniref:solute carrier organic anion transporter family member 1A2-like isoform X2 n=1 Tax=Pleurodeles waltl TaxID=8319 RepID=UPI0037095FED